METLKEGYAVFAVMVSDLKLESKEKLLSEKLLDKTGHRGFGEED
jgi:hypothetical protein